MTYGIIGVRLWPVLYLTCVEPITMFAHLLPHLLVTWTVISL